MVCEMLDIKLITCVFFTFFVTKLEKGRWVTLSSRQTNGLFTHHSNDYKYWKDKFVRLRGRKDSLGMLDIYGATLFVILDGVPNDSYTLQLGIHVPQGKKDHSLYMEV